jgi:hypothetical protein
VCWCALIEKTEVPQRGTALMGHKLMKDKVEPRGHWRKFE